MVCLLVVMITVHAALAVTDLIQGFGKEENALAYFSDAGRPLVLAILVIYAVNVSLFEPPSVGAHISTTHQVNIGDVFMVRSTSVGYRDRLSELETGMEGVRDVRSLQEARCNLRMYFSTFAHGRAEKSCRQRLS